MKTLSIGKYRGLQQCSTPNAAISVLALDHRNNLRNMLCPEHPETVTDAQLTEYKCDVVRFVSPAASAVLLDPQFGAAQSIQVNALPGNVGLLLAVEETGYTGDPQARQSTVLPGLNAAKVRRMGATAIKLLVYYHPDAPTAGFIENLVKEVAEDCAREDIPLFLEPLSYSLDPKEKKLAPADRRRVVIETARRLTPLGVDILKAEFPLDIASEPDEAAWAKACAELSTASICPWILLSASVSFETYLRQVTIACNAGASGVAVGRAVWQEAVALRGAERGNFLSTKVYDRMQRITALCTALAKPWTDFYATGAFAPDWYQGYAPDLSR